MLIMIKNTEKKPFAEWLFGGNPKAICEQEKEGQRQLVETSFESTQQLPAKGNRCDAPEVYKGFGFEIIGPSDDDPLFLDVKLTDGWKVKPTRQNMWSSICDEKGRRRASIFYKAAFYDRKAFINTPETRFSVEQIFFDSPPNLDYHEGVNITPIVYAVLDCDKEIFRTEEVFFTDKYSRGKSNQERINWSKKLDAIKERARNEARQWLTERYPNCENPAAYWD